MKKISIKTVDGGRFDYVDKNDLIPSVTNLLNSWNPGSFYGFPVEGGYKFFNRDNVVSVSVKEVDE